jgi:hypothetical protein
VYASTAASLTFCLLVDLAVEGDPCRRREAQQRLCPDADAIDMISLLRSVKISSHPQTAMDAQRGMPQETCIFFRSACDQLSFSESESLFGTISV